MNKSTRFWAHINLGIIIALWLTFIVTDELFYLMCSAVYTLVAIFMLLLGQFSRSDD